MRYDLVVIGNDTAAQSGALAAARLSKRVALVEQTAAGAGKPTRYPQVLSARVLSDAVRFLANERGPVSMSDLRRRVKLIVDRESFAIRDRLDLNEVDLYRGHAHFARPHEIVVHTINGDIRLEADRVLIACGTQPMRPERIPFDRRRVIDFTELLELESIPGTLTIVGGGRSGIEAALLLAHLGARVTLLDAGDQWLEGFDADVVERFLFRARAAGVEFQGGREVIGIDNLAGKPISLHFADGEILTAEQVLYAAGRVGATEGLQLKGAGLETDERGRIWCDEQQRTWASHIYGAGEVVGFPVLGGTAGDQGRRAIFNAFGVPFQGERLAQRELCTIPALAAVGQTDAHLSQQRVPYQTRSIPYGDSGSPESGEIKLLCHATNQKLLGVTCLGEAATEVVRLVQEVIAADGTFEDFGRSMTALPTLSGYTALRLGEETLLRRIDGATSAVATAEPHTTPLREKSRTIAGEALGV